MTTYSRDSLPSDPATWPQYRKRVLTRAVRIDGPFTVDTSEGPLRCTDGYLAVDARGYPYPVAADEFALIYEKAGGIRYHVLISDELARQMEPDRLPAGFRLVEQEVTDFAVTPSEMHWWLVEDAEADRELEGKRVELTMMRGRASEDDLYDTIRITERRVLP